MSSENASPHDSFLLYSSFSIGPICLFHDAKYFLAKAVDGASRCCGDDTSKCRCPKQDTDKYKKSIGDWCAGIAKCPQSTAEDEVDDVNEELEVEEALE